MATRVKMIVLVVCLISVAFGKPQFRGAFHDLPEEHLNISEIITFNGYPCENHEILTEDGYILSVQRIPHGRLNTTKGQLGPVFLQHGIIDSAATWAMNAPDQSLAYVLADHGYDVWLGNSRGNTYSNKHVKYTTDDAAFWDFSFDRMAKYDLPACINYILKATGHPDLYYVGHSQGTLIGFVEFGRNPSLGKLVKKFFALAPVATVGHIEGAMKVLSYFTPEIEFLFKIFGVRNFLPNNWLIKAIAEVVCATQWSQKLCGNFIFLIAGFDTKNLNESRIPVYLTHLPAGTSVKDVVHFVQMVKSGLFQSYDYGKDGNMQHYGQPSAPLYNISAMETPVAVFSGSNDWLADPYDVNSSLLPNLQNVIYKKNLDDWNHLDFVWGVNARNEVYADILNLMADGN